MRPIYLDIDPANVSTTGFDTGLTGAGPFTPSTTATPDGLAHQVSLTSTANLSAITMTLVGTDADGRAQTEDVAGPNNNTVEGSKYFKTLTSIVASSTLGASTMDVGYVDEVASQTIPLDFYASDPASVQVSVTGTINFDVEGTLSNPFDTSRVSPFDFDDQSDLDWLNDSNFTSKTASLANALAIPGIRAIRIVINSYTDTAELQVFITQPQAN